MFGLPGKVGSHDVRVGGLVGNHGDLGGAGEHIDTDPSVQDTLGFSDKAVSRAYQYVGRVS